MTAHSKKSKYAEWGLDDVPGDGRLKHASYNVGISAMAAKYRNDKQLADEVWHMIHNDLWLSMPLNDKVIDKDFETIINELKQQTA